MKVYADLLPLELLQIAGLPDQNGYECVLVDATKKLAAGVDAPNLGALVERMMAMDAYSSTLPEV